MSITALVHKPRRPYSHRAVSSSAQDDVARLEAQLTELDDFLDRLPQGDLLKEARRMALERASILQEQKQAQPAYSAERRRLNRELKRLSEFYSRSQTALGRLPSKSYRVLDWFRKGVSANQYMTDESRQKTLEKLDRRVAEGRYAINREMQYASPERRRKLTRLLTRDVVVSAGKGIKPRVSLNTLTGAWSISGAEISLKIIQDLNKELGDGRYVADLLSLVPDAERDNVRGLKGTPEYRQAIELAAKDWFERLRNNIALQLYAARKRANQ